MSKLLKHPELLRARAEAMRIKAARTKDVEMRGVVLQIAERFERIAVLAEDLLLAQESPASRHPATRPAAARRS